MAGVVDEQAGEELALDLSGLAATHGLSAGAGFSYSQINWRTYEFTTEPELGVADPTYAWDFGDGSTSVQPTVTHKYLSTGRYTVTLATLGSDGAIKTDTQELTISFFHLSNPWLLLTLGVLLIILIGLVVLILRLRRGEEV